MSVPVSVTGEPADLQGHGPAAGQNSGGAVVLRKTVGTWSAGTRIVVRGWVVGDGQTVIVSPECDPQVNVRVSMFDLVPLRRRRAAP